MVLIASVTTPLIITGCGDKEGPTKPVVVTPTVASVTVSPASATLEVGGSQRFSASARSSDGSAVSGVSFSWSSSNTSVVTINVGGVATAVGPGTATIKATGNGVSSPAVTVTVTQPPVTRITVSPSSAQQLNVGDTRTFTAAAFTAGGSERDDVTFTWSSSDETVVSINAFGLATALGAGTATISAATGGVTSLPVSITVSEPPPMVSSVTVSPSMASIETGETQQFEAVALTTDGTAVPDVTFTWTSSDTAVATIDASGLATGVRAGSAAITATSGDLSGIAMLMVSVPPPAVSSVTVSPSMASIETGETQQFEAMALTSDGMSIPGLTFTWTSNDMIVATIDDSGLATGVGVGDAVITATVDDVSGTAMLMVSVPPPVVSSVTVSPSMASIKTGETRMFEAIALTSDGMTIPGVTIAWSSSNMMVATIDESGLAMGVGTGEAVITATVDDVPGTATLVVTEPPPVVSSVTVSPSMASIETGETQQFEAMALTSDGMAIPGVTFAWTSSDMMVATIDDAGLATGVGAGDAVITATVDNVSGTAMLTVSVPPPVVSSVTVSPSAMTMVVGGTFQFSATALTAVGMELPEVTIVWSSDDAEVASVDDTGLVTAVVAGTAMITASADGVTSMPATVIVEELPPEVASVTVEAPSVMLVVGESLQLLAIARTSEGMMIGGVMFEWSSDDVEVATVDATGLVTAVGAGMANITATVDGVSSESVMVMVSEPPPVVSIVTVGPETASIASVEIGMAIQLSAVALTSDDVMIPDAMFTWMSSDETVATVTQTGLATGVAAGETRISATADRVTGMVTLTVTEPKVVDRIAVSPSSATIDEDGTHQFMAVAYTVEDEEIENASFSWESSDTSVATIDSTGLATGVRAGSSASQVTITARADGKEGMATLTVEPVISSVTVSPPSATIERGSTRRFLATAYTSYDVAISNVSISWSSSDPSVVAVTSTGWATGVSAGTATISARAGDRTGSASLTVTEPPPPTIARISVSPPTSSVDVGSTQRFTATAFTSNGSVVPGVTFAWTSSNTNVATINGSSGVARGVNPDTTTIRAQTDGITGTATLTVTTPPPVVAIVRVDPTSPSIEEGDTQRFTAAAFTSGNAVVPGVTFTWTSSNTSVATISRTSGLATGVSEGSTTITATGGGISGRATLTVSAPPPPPPPPPMMRSRTGSISGWSGYTSAAGSVTFSEIAGGRLKLEITGLNDGNAPDAWLALYTSSRIDWDAGASLPDGARGFGEVTNQSSFSRTFTPRSGETIDSYSHVVLHCRAFKVGIARASLSN